VESKRAEVVTFDENYQSKNKAKSITRFGKRRTDTNRPIKIMLKNNEDQKSVLLNLLKDDPSFEGYHRRSNKIGKNNGQENDGESERAQGMVST